MTSSQTTENHFTQLEGARGLAALAVAAAHCGQSTWSGGDLLLGAYDRGQGLAGWFNTLAVVLCSGHGAVIFFFVLSGFVLAHSSRPGRVVSGSWWRRFLWHRILRIYPAVVVSTALFSGLFFATGYAQLGVGPEQFQPLEILLNMLLVHTSINGVTWTLRIEMLAIPFVLISLLLWHRNRQTWIVGIFILLTSLHFSHGWRDTMGAQFAFVLGVLVKVYEVRVTRYIGKYRTVIAFAAVAVLLWSPSILGPGSLWRGVAEAFAAAGWIACSVGETPLPFWSWMNSRPIRFMGNVSYSFYLLHPICLIVFWRAGGWIDQARVAGIPSTVVLACLTGLSCLFIYPLAWLSRQFVELKLQRLRQSPCTADSTMENNTSLRQSQTSYLLSR